MVGNTMVLGLVAGRDSDEPPSSASGEDAEPAPIVLLLVTEL